MASSRARVALPLPLPLCWVLAAPSAAGWWTGSGRRWTGGGGRPRVSLLGAVRRL